MGSVLLTADELAERLAVSPATVIAWARAGKIPEVRLSGRTRRFDFDEVMAATRKNREKGVPHA
jgi:excisionase family DNA binding protein